MDGTMKTEAKSMMDFIRTRKQCCIRLEAIRKKENGSIFRKPTVSYTIPGGESDDSRGGTSKSKTAEQLDENFKSQVALSLPSAEEQLVSDVVLVLDKSTSTGLKEQALEMLQNLKKEVQEKGAKVKVGVVLFNKEAHTDGFMDLETQYEAIEAAICQEIKSGTNLHAGILAVTDVRPGYRSGR